MALEIIVDVLEVNECIAWITEQCGIELDADVDGRQISVGPDMAPDLFVVGWTLCLDRLPMNIATMAKLRWHRASF